MKGAKQVKDDNVLKEDEEVSGGLSLKMWLRLAPYFAKMKKQTVIAAVFMVASTAVEAAFPLFTSFAVNNFVMPRVTDGLMLFALVFLLFIVFAGVCVLIYAKQLMAIEMKMGLMLRRDCFVRLQELPLSFHNVNSVGYLIGRIMSDTDRISGMISWGFSHCLSSLLYILFCVMFMFILNPTLALVLVLIIPAAAIIAWLFQRKIIVVNRSVREVNSLITGAYNEGITGSKTSKTLVIEDLNRKEFEKLSGSMSTESVRAARLNAFMIPLMISIGSIALSVVLYRGGFLVHQQLLDFGILAAFITYAVSVIEPVVHMVGILSEMMTAQVGIERVTSIIKEPLTITDAPEVVEKYGDTFNPKRENWEPVIGRVTFENVWFMYPDGEEYVLEDFSLDIPHGTTIAIVGETGAGKSTIVNLACRFYEPTKGRVLIDGRDSRARSQLWLHSSLGYVLQDPHLFSGTIMDNIRYAKLDATDDEVIAAAKLVSADVVAERLPDGYNTEVGEGGDRLSTGEKQLISFARAILANPPIFVLDEATSSIDTETELLIQNAVSHMLNDRTSFIIAHRLSTIARADIILVVQDGKIVERGTHSELISANGHYSTLYKAMRLEELGKR